MSVPAGALLPAHLSNALIEQLGDPIVFIDANRSVIGTNDACQGLFGFGAEELLGQPVMVMCPPEMKTIWLEALAQAGEGQVAGPVETRGLTRERARVPLRITLIPEPGERAGRIVMLMRDLTEVKAARSENVAMALFAQLNPAPAMRVHKFGEILWVNPAAVELFGDQALPGTHIPEDIAPGSLKELVRDGAICTRDVEIGGRSFRLAYQGIPSLGVAQISGVETTETRNAEILLLQARKLEAIGQLAAGIAHEINTPMQYISDNTEFLRAAFDRVTAALDVYQGALESARAGGLTEARLAETDAALRKTRIEQVRAKVPAAIRDAIDGVERVTEIVRAMKEFSHPGSEGKTEIDLNHTIETTLTVCRNEYKYVADVVLELDPALPRVPCLPKELGQVVLNMIVNAAHAMEDKVESSGARGRITVATRHDESCAEIRISDTGGGIPEDIRGRLFEPFFTTKEVGKGTGQGLAISHSVIVDKHGGSIGIDSEVGVGTTFIIRLPLTGNALSAGKIAA